MRKKRTTRVRKDLSYKPKGVAKRKKRVVAPKTRNAGRWSESQFWQFIRSALRNKSRFWIPRLEALKEARRPSQSANKRLRWEFKCFKCGNWHPMKNVEVHHLEPAGKLNNGDDLKGFVEKLFCEKNKLAVICKPCHKQEHE